MPRLRLSRRQQAAVAVALALLLWIPQGISHGDQTVVVGHSTFYNGDAYDPCLASIAGIMRSRVMWFNDQVLVERYGSEGTFVYVTQAGAPDPREKTLYTEGVFYDFVDPNGARWRVEEAFYNVSGRTPYADYTTDPVSVGPVYTTNGERIYVWIVELSSRPIYDRYAGDDPHTFYNFLTLVDTCKMQRSEDTMGANETHDVASGKLNAENGHENGAQEHSHETYFADLWVGKRPALSVGGASTQGAEWSSAWAASEAQDEANGTTEEGFDGVLP